MTDDRLGRRPIPTYVGASRMGFDRACNETEIQNLTQQQLARELNTRRVVAFVGAGVSRAYGYITWSELATKIAESTKSALETRGDASCTVLALLDDFLSPSKQDSARSFADNIQWVERLLLVLNECRVALAPEPSDEGVIERIIRAEFREARETLSETKPDPLKDVLLQLGVRRFVTTNYDLEIERAFYRCLGSPPRPLRLDFELGDDACPMPTTARSDAVAEPPLLGPLARSLSIDPLDPEAVVQFAVGAPGYEQGVFHCHGDALTPGSAIVSERDYQRLYLFGDRQHTSHREAVELILAANPILFLGLGFQETDILRPLRQFVAERGGTDDERPLFALIERSGNRRYDTLFRKHLYVRYGVKVLFYQHGGELRSRQERSLAFCSEIQRMARERDRWWSRWQEKPPIREAKFSETRRDHIRSMVHHRQIGPTPYFDNRMARARVAEALRGRAPKNGDKSVSDAAPRHSGTSSEAGLQQDQTTPGAQLQAVETVAEAQVQPDEASTEAQARPRENRGLVVIYGDTGVGKGSIGLELALGFDRDNLRFKKRFFATTHFTNEFLSVLDAAEKFFSDELQKTEKRPLEALERALNSSSSLLIIGGAERLMRPIPNGRLMSRATAVSPTGVARRAPDRPMITNDRFGMPLTSGIKRFFELADRCDATVVLTSTLVPHGLDKRNLIHLPGVEVSTPTSGLSLSTAGVQLLSRIRSTLSDHAYALAVLFSQIEGFEGDSSATTGKLGSRHGRIENWLAQVLAEVTAIDPARRPEQVVRIAIERFCDSTRSRHENLPLLQMIALVTTPLTPGTIAEALQMNCQHTEQLLEHLVKMRLALKVEGYPHKEPSRYTAHSLVRSHILHLIGCHPMTPGEPHRFLMAGFATESDEPLPMSKEAHQFACGIVDRLLDRVEEQVCRPAERVPWSDVVMHCRAIFGAIRARWNALALNTLATVPREAPSYRSHYQTYEDRLIRLLNVMRQMADDKGEAWFSLGDREKMDSAMSANGVLYADELAWLYNELGLLAFSRGILPDAWALWSSGQSVNSVAEREGRGRRWRRARLNFAMLDIERGNLRRARDSLDLALESALTDEDASAEGSATGFLGMVYHLGGDDKTADQYYTDAIRILRTQGIQRGTSLFLRLLGDLDRAFGRFGEAQKNLRRSAAAAEQGRHLDLLCFTRLSEATLARARGEPKASVGVSKILDFGRLMGIPKLEADAYKVLADGSLSAGDLRRADRLARQALSIATRNDMRIRQTAALVLMGRVARADMKVEGARAFFEAAIRLGRAQGYNLQVDVAERELLDLGIEPFSEA